LEYGKRGQKSPGDFGREMTLKELRYKKILLISILAAVSTAVLCLAQFLPGKKKTFFSNNNFPEDNNEKLENNPDGQKKDTINIKSNLVSWGFSVFSSRSIDTIIVHSSYNALGGDEYDFEKLLLEYKEYGVAPHYLIDREGLIYQLVEDKNVAWHAGESRVPDGRKGVNEFSIGIELMNTKTDKYTSAQYSSLSELLSYLKGKYKIKYTLGHKDIAPGRKDDPWNFDWGKVK
jgi:hypothetical protein